MSTFEVESFGESKLVVILERSFESLPHLVFRGTNSGLMHRIYSDYVTEGGRLEDTLKHLRAKPWMTDELFEEFKAEVPWLSSQG